MSVKEKKNLLMLHGALGAATQLQPLAEKLGRDFQVHTFNFPGHGGMGDAGKAFRIEKFADALEEWLKKRALQQISVFGYSMGGYVALYLASRSPGYFTDILTLGTKFDWTTESAAGEAKRLLPEIVEQKVPAFAQSLAKLHHPHDWRLVMRQTAEMMLAMGGNPVLTPPRLQAVKVPVTIMRGTEDRMVGEEESRQVAGQLPQARFVSLAAQPHPLEQQDLDVLAGAIRLALGHPDQ